MPVDAQKFDQELKSLKIDRSSGAPTAGPKWATWWILTGVAVIAALLVWQLVLGRSRPVEVETMRVSASSSGPSEAGVVLNATGYIVAHHKIEVSCKVIGRVAWIGVEKGDRVQQGQVVVRLEDQEYRAQVEQAAGNVANLEARLKEMETGSRPQEIAAARANQEQGQADLENARVNLDRVRGLVTDGVMPKQSLDDAQARFDGQKARVDALQKNYELVRIGPRIEQIDAVRGQLRQARGQLAYAQTMLDSTVIRAPVNGTILERAVEVGEFVTTSFVGERGAKGYVVSLADLNDLQVELDINQDDFARLGPRQRGIVTTDAFPDRKYEGAIEEISPQADRQKATVQVKVKILRPDDYLRPEMNARVAFLADEKTAADRAGQGARPLIVIPASALRDGKAVLLASNGKVVERAVKVRSTTSRGAEIGEGLSGGEEIILNPPAGLKNGDRVAVKSSRRP
ncbi:MAG: efflux RND transporter periplasmic adaptor subunit [Acidobacteria bacterium]|nr:efflux RND transporter periplasmic adaptor subunit [Acidobacteriota bacterium]